MKISTKFGYYLLRTITWLVKLFPLKFHYFISDMVFPLVYYVVRYRRSVVTINLTNSFPEKSKQEIIAISKKFYHYFCDSFIETLYFDRISKEEIKLRHPVKNIELLEKYMDEGRSVIVVFGHYNNWEWNCSMSLHSDKKGYVVYKKLTNKSFDLFFNRLRGRFGITPLERADTYKQLISDFNNKIVSASAFVMDQTPRKYEIQYWTTFLNQETPVLTGTEKIARKLDAAVLFCKTEKIKRGYNLLQFTVLAEHAKKTAPFEITEKATRMIEAMIVERPEFWLWSHKRWKHKKEPNARLNHLGKLTVEG